MVSAQWMRFQTFEDQTILINMDQFILMESTVLPDGTQGIQIANYLIRGDIDDLALQIGAETFNPR